MPYTKRNWESGIVPLSKTNLAAMDDAIYKNATDIEEIKESDENNVKTDFTIAGLKLTKPITVKELQTVLLINKVYFVASEPTTSTRGRQGDLFCDTTKNKLYLCVSVAENTYTWVDICEFIDISDEIISTAISDYLKEHPLQGTGADGKSAYQIAIDNGFEGSEEEWLESLRGQDGFSPSLSVSTTETGYKLTIEHDENYEENVFVEHGKDGADGKSAYEYAKESGYTGTEEEFAQSLNYVNTVDTLVDEAVENEKGNIIDSLIAELQGLPVFGTVDENNIIKVTSQLSDGVYVLRYENTDGTYSDVGVITIGNGDVVTYTNLNDPTLATDEPLTPISVGWLEDVRISSSSSSISNAEGYDISNFVTIPADKEVVRIKNFNLYNAYGRIYFYSGGEYKYQLSNINTTGAAHFTTVNEEYAEITVAKLTEVYKSAMGSSATFESIRFGGMLVGTIEDVIITLDEAIT